MTEEIMLERKNYLNQLLSWKDKQIIKVITGIRRCGKSTLLQQFQTLLFQKGIQKEQVISINFEDMEYEELLDYKKLYQYIKQRLMPEKNMYIFLDEVQNVDQYEKVVDSLFVQNGIDIYITGSNSYMFSGQLATNLRGRYIEISMLPLSFKEFALLYPTKDKRDAFNWYLKVGGFPYLQGIQESDSQIRMYLEGIYNTVLLKDIEERLNRKQKQLSNTSGTDVALLKSISKYLASVIGSPVSIRGITNYLKSNERKVSPNTVSDYITALSESYLYYPVDAINANGKEILKSNRKYYIVDLGIRNFVLPKTHYDIGFSIENLVYFELLRRGYEVNIGKINGTEIDFVAKKDGAYTYIQVSASLLDESTFKREITPLQNIHDNYEKFILTLDDYSEGNYNGILIKNVINWLLEE